MSGTQLNTELRLTANNSDLLQKNAQVKASNAEIGASAKKAGADATAGMNQAVAATQGLANSAVNARNIVATLGPAVSTASAEVVSSNAASAASFDTIAASAQSSAARTVASINSMSASYAAFQAEAAVVQSFMATEAKSLDDVIERRLGYQEALQAGILTQEEFAAANAALVKEEAALVASSEKHAASVDALIQKYTSGSSAAQKLAADEALLNEALKSGAVDAPAINAALAAIAAKQKALSETETGLTLNTSNVRREFGLLAKDIATGDFSRAEREIGTLAGSTGVARLAFTGWGAAIVAVIGTIALLVGGLVAGYEEQGRYERALISTGNSAGVTVGQLNEMRDTIAGSLAEYGKASEALTTLASSGKFSGQQLQFAAQAAVSLSDVTGQSIEKTVSEIEKLADKPTAAIVKLNDQYHFLTQAEYDHISALEKEGDVEGATTAALKAAADENQKRSAQLAQNAGTLVQWYDTLASSARSAWQAIKDIGRTDLDAQYVQALKDYTRAQENVGVNARSAADVASQQAYADKLKATVLALRDQIAAENASAAATGAHARSTAAGIDAQQKFADEFDKLNKKYTEQAATIDRSAVSEVEYERTQALASVTTEKYGDAVDAVKAKINAEADAALVGAKAADAAAAAKKGAAEAARLWAEDERTLQQVIDDANVGVEKAFGLAQQLAQGSEGPFAQANNQYWKSIETLADGYADLDTQLNLGLISQQKWADGQKIIDGAVDDAIAARNREIDAIKARLDVGTTLIQKLQDENEALSQGTAAQQAWLIVEQAARQADKNQTDLAGNIIRDENQRAAAIKAQIPIYAARAEAIIHDNELLKQNEQINQEWVGIASNGLDSFGNSISQFVTGGIKGWHSFWQSLLQDTQQFIGAIIQQMLKLTVFNGIINNLFGLSGSSALPTGLGNGLIGQLLGTATGGGLATTGSIAGGGSYALQDVGGGGGFLSNIGGGLSNFAFGSGATTGFFNSSLSSMFGGGAGSWGGAVGSVVGGAFGGYELGKQLFHSTVGGVVTGAAVATAAYFIPVIGWAFAAASLINSLTGGNVFGTDYAPTGQTSMDINVGAGGSSVQDYYQEHKHGALFSGGKYKDVAVAAPQDQLDALSAFDKQLQQTNQSAADALGIAVADTVTGAFHAAFDKSGKLITSTSTILGQTFQNESQQDFLSREIADNLLAQVNKALGSDEASQIAEQYQSNAQTLLAAAQMLVAAQVDVHDGMSLLGDDHSLTDIAAEVSKLNVSGESLVQTYVRLQTETQDVKATLDAMGLTTSKVGADFVQFSDDLVKAAGSLDNLNSLTSAYYQAFYSPAEQAAAKLKADTSTRDKLFAGIGQDPNESMAQFKATFQAVFDTLSPEDVVKWYQAGLALAAVNQDLGNTADAAAQAKQQYEAFIQPYRDAVAGVTNFEAAVRGMGGSLNDAIAQANALAQAQGLQGASAGDVAAIIQTFSVQGANALAQFQQETQAIASKLYGADYLQGLQDDFSKTGNVFDLQKISDAQGAQVKQQDNSRYLDAYQLANNAAQIAAFTGGSVEDILQSMGVPLSALTSDLKLQGQSLEDYLGKLEDQAKVNMDISNNTEIANHLLQDILDQVSGKPLTYTNPSDFGFTDPNTTQAAASGGKPVGRGVPGPTVVTPQPVGVTPAPPATGGDGGDGSDVGKQIGRVGDAVASIPSALGSQGADVKAALASVAAAVLQLNATINRYGLARPTQPVTN